MALDLTSKFIAFFIRFKYQDIFCNYDTEENDTEEICPSSMYDIFPTRIISVGSNTLIATDSNCSVIDSENNSVAIGDIRDNSITLPTQITQSDDDNK